jgi:N-acetylmuramoyl-L-alanine amidase
MDEMIYPTRKSTDLVVLHCTATPEGKELTGKDIDRMHRKAGLNGIGFHYVVRLDGTIDTGRPEIAVGAHAQGYNANTIAVAYVGGTDTAGKAKDTRTDAQKGALMGLLLMLKGRYPGVRIVGHRDILANAGRADPFLRLKDSPCFDAAADYPHH